MMGIIVYLEFDDESNENLRAKAPEGRRNLKGMTDDPDRTKLVGTIIETIEHENEPGRLQLGVGLVSDIHQCKRETN